MLVSLRVNRVRSRYAQRSGNGSDNSNCSRDGTILSRESPLAWVVSVVPSTLFAFTCSSCGGSTPSPPPTYSVGGTVAGLGSGSTLTLSNDGGHALSISGNGAFTFTDALLSGSTYAVTVSSQPTNELCSVSNGTGTVEDASICLRTHTLGHRNRSLLVFRPPRYLVRDPG
jgi:hypothetical protein